MKPTHGTLNSQALHDLVVGIVTWFQRCGELVDDEGINAGEPGKALEPPQLVDWVAPAQIRRSDERIGRHLLGSDRQSCVSRHRASCHLIPAAYRRRPALADAAVPCVTRSHRSRLRSALTSAIAFQPLNHSSPTAGSQRCRRRSATTTAAHIGRESEPPPPPPWRGVDTRLTASSVVSGSRNSRAHETLVPSELDDRIGGGQAADIRACDACGEEMVNEEENVQIGRAHV